MRLRFHFRGLPEFYLFEQCFLVFSDFEKRWKIHYLKLHFHRFLKNISTQYKHTYS